MLARLTVSSGSPKNLLRQLLPPQLLPPQPLTKTDTKIPGAPAPHQPLALQPVRKRTRAHTETTEDFESEARRSEPPRKKTDIKNPDAPT
jgi:hypothetical protein